MKKTLAIVLALAMVLCMMPAAFANTTKTITDKSYNIEVKSFGTVSNGNTMDATASAANSITANYYYEDEGSDTTGKFTEDKKMALVSIDGWDAGLAALNASDATITIDGKTLEVNSTADYANDIGLVGGKVVFPAELTKSGYSDTYLVTLKGTVGTEDITESAKITVKFVNKSSYKDAKTATISSITGDGVDAYIVGSKIYLDFAAAKFAGDAFVKLTFKDETGAKFSAVTWGYKGDADDVLFTPVDSDKNEKTDGWKLSSSALNYKVTQDVDDDDTIAFKLETAGVIYETKGYHVVVRENIVEDDPKGIYFADSTKTIKVGESYTPVVMGVATGKALPYRNGVGATSKLSLEYGLNTSKQYIDVEDGSTVIGTQEGVAYITAVYTTNDGKVYNASSMKIIVVAGEAIDPNATATTYVVTCRVLNVRKGAGTSYAKAGKVTRGTKLSVVSISNGWAKLSNGTFVAAKYISK